MISKKVIDSWGSYFSADESKDSMRCPRCGAELESVGGGPSYIGISRYGVVPPIFVLKCPQCGYTEQSWAKSIRS